MSGASAAIVTVATKGEVLLALVTVEGLVFAALSVTAALASGSSFGSKTLGPSWVLSLVASALLVLIAVPTILAWCDLFAGSGWSTSTDRCIEVLALLLAIVAQPAIAVLISWGLVKNRSQ